MRDFNSHKDAIMLIKFWVLDFTPQLTISPQRTQAEILRLESCHLEVKQSLEWQLKHLWIRMIHPHYNSPDTDSVIEDWKVKIYELFHHDLNLFQLGFQMGTWGMFERAQYDDISKYLLAENEPFSNFKFEEFVLSNKQVFLPTDSWNEITWIALWKSNSTEITPWRTPHKWQSWPHEWVIHLADPSSQGHPDFQFVREQFMQSTLNFDVNDLPDCLKSEWEVILRAKN